MTIHDKLHALVLRKRWIRWSRRNYRHGDYSLRGGRMQRLSARLTKWRPIGG